MEDKRKKAKSRDKSKKKLSKKNIITILFIVITFSGAFIFYFILQVVLDTSSPLDVVISDSMEPSLHRGDLLILQGKDPAEIKNGTVEDQNGDIIVFNAQGLWYDAPDTPIVHRIVGKWYNESIESWFFYTKGDANEAMDGAYHPWLNGVPIPASRIIGVVIGEIPYIGWIKIVLSNPIILIPLLIILSSLLILSIIRNIIKDKKKVVQNLDRLVV